MLVNNRRISKLAGSGYFLCRPWQSGDGHAAPLGSADLQEQLCAVNCSSMLNYIKALGKTLILQFTVFTYLSNVPQYVSYSLFHNFPSNFIEV